DVPFHMGWPGSPSKRGVRFTIVPPRRSRTQRSLFCTEASRRSAEDHAIHRLFGDHAKGADPTAPSMRMGPPLAGTMPMSVRYQSSCARVGLTRTARLWESGDQRTFHM